jgi:phage terminase small subunit
MTTAKKKPAKKRSRQPKAPSKRPQVKNDPKTGLNAQQDAFCHLFVANKGAIERSAIEAGYSPKTAASQANKLLKIPKIKKRIEFLTDKYLKPFDINASEVVKEMRMLAFSDIRNYITWDGKEVKVKTSDEMGPEARCIQKVEIKHTSNVKDPNEVTTEFKFWLYPKDKQLDNLGKYLRLWDPDRESDPAGNVHIHNHFHNDKDVQSKTAAELGKDYHNLLRSIQEGQ